MAVSALASTPDNDTSSGALLPTHVAIIMDGNGRWANLRHIPRKLGHRQGAEATRNIVKACVELGIPYLTLYAFSSENWNRTEDEIRNLMALLRYYLKNELADLHKNGVKLHIIGDRSLLEDDIREQIKQAEILTLHNTKLTLTIALSYGSRQELTHAVKEIAGDVSKGILDQESIDESVITHYLYTADIPDPDLLIRTSGEQRISNFLLWQLAYAELYFTDILWPDFDKQALEAALDSFAKRERRYGTI